MGNVRTPSIARWKAVVNFLFAIIELFPLSFMVRRRYKRKSIEVDMFRRVVGHFERKFQTEGASPTNHCQCQKTRVIAISDIPVLKIISVLVIIKYGDNHLSIS